MAKTGERACGSCGQILRVKNKDEYIMKVNKKRNVYYCMRCFKYHDIKL